MLVRVIQALLQTSWLGFLAGLVLGVVVQYTPIFILAAVALILGAGVVVAREVKRLHESRRRAQQFVDFRDPDKETRAFANKHGHTGVVVGKVIEIWTHHSLESLLPLPDLGIDPRIVSFGEPEPKDFSHALDRCGGLRSFPPPNQRKYGIARLPIGTMDDGDYMVRFVETDWNTYMSVRTRIENDLDLRHTMSHMRSSQMVCK